MDKRIDLSGVVTQTDTKLEQLGWTREQCREHLIKTYDKRGRTLLTEDEMVDFLQFLKSQLEELEGYPEGEGALNKYYSDMLDRPDDCYEIDSDVCGECWEDGLVSILDPRDNSCPVCD